LQQQQSEHRRDADCQHSDDFVKSFHHTKTLARCFCFSGQFLKPFFDLPIRLLIDHLIPIALVLYDLLKGTDVIFCFRRRSLEIHSFPNRVTHDLCLMRL
jgi:hypothetical protein